MASFEASTLACHDDLGEWDQFVDESPQGCIFCRSWWLRAVAPDSFEILILRRAGRIVAGMPMVMRRSFGCLSIGMPKLTQTLGVLMAPSAKARYVDSLSEQMGYLDALIAALPGFAHFGVNFHPSFMNWLPFKWNGYSQTTRYTYVLDSIGDTRQVSEGFAKQVRRMIARAQDAGITAQTLTDVEELMHLNELTFRRQGLRASYSRRFFRQLDGALAQHEARFMLIARDSQGTPHSAVYVVYDPKRAYLVAGGSDPSLRHIGAEYLLVREAIRSASASSQVFDFAGSVTRNFETHLRQYGGRQTPYFHISKGAPPVRAALALRRAATSALLRVGPWR